MGAREEELAAATMDALVPEAGPLLRQWERRQKYLRIRLTEGLFEVSEPDLLQALAALALVELAQILFPVLA